MEMLGYKVADIVETATLLLDVWLDYYDGKATIEGKGRSCISKSECVSNGDSDVGDIVMP